MRQLWYVLADDGETPVPIDSVTEWGRWFETTDRHVAESVFDLGDGEQIVVSTVFLGLDHRPIAGVPILWESMVFGGGPLDHVQQRYSSAREARAGHNALVERVHQLVLLRQQAAER